VLYNHVSKRICQYHVNALPLPSRCSHPGLDFLSSVWYSRKNWRAWFGSTVRAPDFLAALRRASGGRHASGSYVLFPRTAPGAGLLVLTFADFLGAGAAFTLDIGVAWKFLDDSRRHLFWRRNRAPLTVDIPADGDCRPSLGEDIRGSRAQ
jgi:hypothetical protein